MLLRIAALASVGAVPASYAANFGAADELGLEPEKVQGALVAIAPVVGTARIAAAAVAIGTALGVEIPLEGVPGSAGPSPGELRDGAPKQAIVAFVERAGRRCRSRSASRCSGRRRMTAPYAWVGAVMAEHYAGDDTNVRTLLGGVLAAFAGVNVDDFEATSGAFLRTAQHPTSVAAYLEIVGMRRWSSCSATWRRTGSRTTSPRAGVATSCAR